MKYVYTALAIIILIISYKVYTIEPEATSDPVKIPTRDDNPEAFVCTSDTDCVLQRIVCHGCMDIAINKNYTQTLDCTNPRVITDVYCPPVIPKCENNFCISVIKDPVLIE